MTARRCFFHLMLQIMWCTVSVKHLYTLVCSKSSSTISSRHLHNNQTAEASVFVLFYWERRTQVKNVPQNAAEHYDQDPITHGKQFMTTHEPLRGTWRREAQWSAPNIWGRKINALMQTASPCTEVHDNAGLQTTTTLGCYGDVADAAKRHRLLSKT